MSPMALSASTSTITTAEQLLHVPKDSLRRELIRGAVRAVSPGGAEHGRIAWIVAGLLFAHVRGAGGGVAFGAETGFVLARDPDTVRAPDAAFVSQERFDAVGRIATYWPGAPDLAVEVVSPGDSFHDIQEKALEWVAAGCLAVLVVDPEERNATVYRSDGDAHVHREGEAIDLSDAVPGFSLPLGELFG